MNIAYTLLIAPFVEFAFMRHALVGAVTIALGASPIGVFLVLRRMSLVADAMSHAVLPGAAVGYLLAGLSLSAMTLGGLITGCIVAMLAALVTRNTVLKEDAALASFYILSLAIGVIVVSLRGSNIDLLHVLFGSVLALDAEALNLMGEVTSLTLITLAILFRPLVIDCVDPNFHRSISHRVTLTRLIFLLLVVMNLVACFHAIGTLLAVGVMMLPAIAARFWSASITAMLVIASFVGVVSAAVGVLLSYHLAVPTGPTIMVTAGGILLGSMVLGSQGGLLRHGRWGRGQQA